MDIELRQLRCVVALAEHKNFGRAARALHLSQPALSRTVQELEASLGKRLFERSIDGTHLTDDGELFVEQARKLLEAAERMRHEMKLMHGKSRPMEELRIGMGMYPGDMLLPRVTAEFLKKRRDVRLKVTTDVYSSVVGLLQRGEIEIAVMDVSGLGKDSKLKIHKLAKYAAYIVLRKGHPLLGLGREPKVREIAKYPWIMPAKASTERFRELLAAAKSEGEKEGRVPEVYVNSVGIMKEIVKATDGWAFVALPNIAEELRSGTIEALATPKGFYESNFAVVWLAEARPSGAAREFMEVVLREDAAVKAEEAELEKLARKTWRGAKQESRTGR